MGGAEHAARGATVELVDPVDVVRTPVVDSAARYGVFGVPSSARVLEPADKGLNVEDVAEVTALHEPAYGKEVGVPAPALMDGHGAVVGLRSCDDFVGVGAGERHRLLHHDVLAGTEEFECECGVEARRCGDHRNIDVGVGCKRGDGVVADEVGEIGASCVDPVGGGVGGSNERKALSFCGGQAVQIAHATKGAVADHGEAECRCRRNERRA